MKDSEKWACWSKYPTLGQTTHQMTIFHRIALSILVRVTPASLRGSVVDLSRPLVIVRKAITELS